MDNKTLAKAGLFCALIAIATMIIKIPIPQSQGYVNFGDGVIFLSALFLANPYCALAAAIGSALADAFLGAGVYIIPTFIIKGIVGYIAVRVISDSVKKTAVGFALAEIFMVLNYFVFEAILYGVAVAAVSIPFNLIQGVFGIVIGLVFVQFAKRLDLHNKF